MKAKGLKKALAVGLSVALVASLAAVGTVSYLESTSGDVINTFSTNNVNVDLKETTGEDYNIIPGTSQEKDPKVTVNASLPAWVYVEVTDETQNLVTWEIADGWTKLDGYDNVYYREFTPAEGEDGNTATYSVLKDNQVSYDASLTNEDMLDEDGALKTGIQLTFKAYAIQKKGFETPEAGWLQIPTEVSSGEDLNAALKTGGNIVLTEDMTAQEGTDEDDGSTYTFINVNSPSDIDLNGYTLTADWINLYADVTIENGTLIVDNYDTLYVDTADTTVTLKNVTLTTPEGEDSEYGIVLFGYYDGVTYILDDVTTEKDISVSSATIVINSGTYDVNISGAREINGGTFNGDIVVEQTEINDGEFNGTITTGGNEFTLTINGGSFNKDSLIDAMNYGTGDVVINGGTFAITNLLGINKSLGNVTISGGTFTNDLTVNTTYMSVINISGGDFEAVSLTGTAYSPITISGGTFDTFSVSDGAKAKLSITGGTFGTNPSDYLKDGYTATANDDGTWTVNAG